MVTWNTEAFTRARNYVFTNQQNCEDSKYLAPAVNVAHFFQTKYKLGIATPNGLSAHTNDPDRNVIHVIEAIHDFCTLFFENLPQISQNISNKKRAMRVFLIKYYFINTCDQILQETAIEQEWQVNAQLCYALFFAIHIFPKAKDFAKTSQEKSPFYANNLHENILFDLKTRLWKHYDSAKSNIPKSDQETFKIATAGLASYSGAFPETTGAIKLNDNPGLKKFNRPKACLPKTRLEKEEDVADFRKLDWENIPRLCILTLQPLTDYNVDHLQCWTDIFEVLKGLLKVSSASKKCTTIEVSDPKFILTGRWNNTIHPDSCQFETHYEIANECIEKIRLHFFCNISNLVLANKDANDAKGSQSLFDYFMDKPLYYLLGDKFVENTNCFASLKNREIVAEYYKRWVHNNALFYKIHRAVKQAAIQAGMQAAMQAGIEDGMQAAMQAGIEDGMQAAIQAGMINEVVPKFAKILSQLRDKEGRDVCPDSLPSEDNIQKWIRQYKRINLNTDFMKWELKDFSPDADEKKTIEKVSRILIKAPGMGVITSAVTKKFHKYKVYNAVAK